MSITVDSTIEQVNNYLKEKLNIDEEILKKIREEKIDGEALILLRKNDFKNLGIQLKDRNRIMENIEKNILKMKNDMQKDDLYGKILNSDSTNLWNYLEANISNIKLGDKLKYIKYVFIKNQPPHKDQNDELNKYFQKYLKLEEKVIKQIIENLEDFLSFKEQDFEEQCQYINIIDQDEQYKLKLIIELIKSNDNQNHKAANEHLSEMNGGVKTKLKINGKNFKIDLEKLIDLTTSNISLKGDYNIYSMIEIYDYETSQEEMTSGLRNPIPEFQKLCNDFGIDCNNECTYINYNQALKISISSAMVWGTKESLFLFFKENEINNAIDYFKKEDIKGKAGIYLCINKKTLNCLLIVWPGELNYKYSKIEEPNNNLLLTLVRYGFSVSHNSILCFTDDELKDINFEGYEIFKEIHSSGFQAERSKIVINVINEKSFDIGQKGELIINKIRFENKINNKLINQNCLLLFEEKDNSKPEIITHNIIDFLKYNSEYDFLFINYLDDIKPAIFYFLIRKNHIFLKDINKEKMFFSKLSLKDAFKRKLDGKIDSALKNLYESIMKINKNNIDKYIKCSICNQCKKDEQLNEFSDFIENNWVFFKHKNCYNKKQSNNNNKEILIVKNKANDVEKFINCIRYNQYIKYKENVLSKLKKEDYIYNIITKYFQNCEEKFNYFSKLFDEKIILDEIESIKESSADQYYDKLKNKLIKEELEINGKLHSNKKDFEKKSEEWKNNWIEKINKYIKENNIKNYIKIISCFKNINIENSSASRVSDWKIQYEYIEYNKKKTYVNLYEIKPIKDSANLTLQFNEELGEESTFENYFPSYNERLIINKDRDKLKVKFKNNNIEGKIELYDYDKMSDTLILYRHEDKIKKLGIYYANKQSETICCNEFILDSSVLNKIMLIPCYPAYEKQSVLLFIDKEIHLIQINTRTEYPKIINLLDNLSIIMIMLNQKIRVIKISSKNNL